MAFFIAKFAYNNIRNASTSYIFFKLNCRYHPYVSYKEDLNLYLKSKTIEKLFFKLQNLIGLLAKFLPCLKIFKASP